MLVYQVNFQMSLSYSSPLPFLRWGCILHEAEEFLSFLEAGLGFEGDFHERFVGVVPGDDASHIGGSPLIVDDEGVDAMAEALLHHYQPTHTAVIVLEGPDPLESDVEIQDALHVGRVLLVVLQQGSEAWAYGLRGDTVLLHGSAVFAGQDFLPAVGIGAVGEGVVELFDESLAQG